MEVEAEAAEEAMGKAGISTHNFEASWLKSQ